MIFATASLLALGGLAYGTAPAPKAGPLEGTPGCPKVTCPLAGTPECPYDMKVAEVPACCKKK